MRAKLLLLACALCAFACACPKKSGGAPGTGSGSGTVTLPAGGCDGARTKVESLYRADGQSAEAVADNTTMVLAECAKAPDRISACIAQAGTAADLEKTCLAPLDDEGSETDVLTP